MHAPRFTHGCSHNLFRSFFVRLALAQVLAGVRRARGSAAWNASTWHAEVVRSRARAFIRARRSLLPILKPFQTGWQGEELVGARGGVCVWRRRVKSLPVARMMSRSRACGSIRARLLHTLPSFGLKKDELTKPWVECAGGALRRNLRRRGYVKFLSCAHLSVHAVRSTHPCPRSGEILPKGGKGEPWGACPKGT